jgi:hypothetical protein
MTDSKQPHFLQFPAPDVVVFRANAAPSLEALSTAMAARAEEGKFYLLIDFSDFSATIDAEMRERGPKLVRPEWLLGLVYVNASTPLRVALKVLKLAMMLSKHSFPTEYADSLEEGLAVVDQMRRNAAT